MLRPYPTTMGLSQHAPLLRVAAGLRRRKALLDPDPVAEILRGATGINQAGAVLRLAG